MARVVVIGAGVGGMAVAARLAVKGHDVTVLEQPTPTAASSAPTSATGSSSTPARACSRCPRSTATCSSRPAARSRTASTCVPLEPAFGYRFADGSRCRCRGSDRAGALPPSARPSAGSGRRLAGAHGARGPDVAPHPRARSSSRRSPAPGDLLPLASDLGDVRTVAPCHDPARPRARSTCTDSRLRQVLDRYATYTGSDPRRAPAVLATVPYVEQTFGAWHVGGGLRRLADALRARARRARGHRPAVDPGDADPARRRTRVRRAARRRRGAARPTSSSPTPTPATSTATCSATRAPRAPVRRLAGPRRRCPASCCCSPSRAARRACRTTTCGSPSDYDAEFDAIFGRRPPAGRRPDGLRLRPRRPAACAPTTTASRGSCW